MRDLVGQRIGQYELVGVLGAGGMGIVYRGRELDGGRPVAIKFILPSMLENETARRRAEIEVAAASQLNHPNIATVYECLVHEGSTGLVMELLDGGNLRQRIVSDGMPLDDILRIGVQLARGLAHAHARGVLHRDVKPDNVLFDSAGTPKITDFGIAKLLFPTGSLASTADTFAPSLTATGALLGTPHYMSPEAAAGCRLDARTDIYSLGVVLFHMASGRLPFTGPAFGAILRAIITDHPIPVRATRPEIPVELEAVIQRAMARDLDLRFQTMEDMAEAIRRVAGAGRAAGFAYFRPRTTEAMIAGRAAELAELEELLDETLNGVGQTAFLAGEAGVGKAHVVGVLARRAAAKGTSLVTGRCLFRDGTRPYGPILDALIEALAAFDVHDTSAFEQFLQESRFPPARVGLIASLLGLPGAPRESAATAEELFDSLVMLLVAITDHRPLVLHVQDLQWADAATLRLFAHLSQMGRRARLLVLASYSPEELQAEDPTAPPLAATLITRLKTDPRVRHLTIAPLEAPAIRAILNTLYPTQRASDGFIARLRELTSGNPALILDSLNRLGLPRPVGEMLTERDLAGIEVAGQIQTLVMERIGRLVDDERELLECAAVEGMIFHSDTLSACLGHSRIPLLRKLQHLEQVHGLVRSGREDYRFASDLVREALYTRIPPELRTEFHRAVGEHLCQARGAEDGQAAAIAHQLLEGGLPDRALPFAFRAGERARRLFATESALHWLGCAEQIAARLPPEAGTPFLAQVREELGAAYLLSGQYARAAECFEATRRFAAGQDDQALICRSLNALGQLQFLRNDQPSAEKLAQAALALAGGLGLPGEVATARTTLADVRWDQGRLEDALTEHRAALAIREELGDSRQTVESLKRVANVHQVRGEHDDALACFDRALGIARQGGDLATEAFVLNGIGGVLLSAGRTGDAIPRLTDALAIRERIGDRRGASKSLNNLGLAFEMQGRTAEALVHYKRSVEVKQEIDDRNGAANSLINIASLEERTGHYDVALQDLAEAQSIKEQIGSRKEIPQCLASQARILCKLHLCERALPLAERAVALAEDIRAVREQSTALAVLGESLEAAGRLDEAMTAYRRAVECARLGQAHDEEFHALRRLVRAQLEHDAAADLSQDLERVEELATRLDLPECRVHLLWIKFCCAVRDGQALAALQQVRQAIELAEGTGLPELAWRLHLHAARLLPSADERARELGRARTILGALLQSIGDPALRSAFAGGRDESEVLAGGLDDTAPTQLR